MRDGWIETSLEEIAEVIMGQSPDGKTYNQSGDGLPFMQGSAEFGEHHPTPEKWCSDPKKIAEPGDLLLSVRAPVGDTNFADQKIAVGRGLSVIRANSNSVTEFIRYVIQLNVAEMIASSGTGMFASITGKNLKEFKVLLPPLPEQKRIVDLISSVDSYIEALQQQLESAKRSRNAVLHKTFHIDGLNWKLQKLYECTQKISDGSHNPPKGIEESEFLMLSSKDIWNGYLTNHDPRFLKQSDFELENKRTQLESGDVLLTVVGTIGRCAVYRGYPKNVTFQRSVCVIKTSKDILNECFLMMYLQSIQSYLDQNARGVAQRGIYLNQIRDLEIPVPTLSEQLAVVSNIEVFDTFIQETQKVVAQTQKLRAAMLTNLLSGERTIPDSYDKVIGAA
jgi:type I restriction enzyme S subunit